MGNRQRDGKVGATPYARARHRQRAAVELHETASDEETEAKPAAALPLPVRLERLTALLGGETATRVPDVDEHVAPPSLSPHRAAQRRLTRGATRSRIASACARGSSY